MSLLESTEEQEAVFNRLQEGRKKVEAELSKAVIGQKAVVEQIMLALISGGHCLITGAPGLAKTLLVKSVAKVFHLDFQRIQFTPDLMPADITGTEIFTDTPEGRKLVFAKGPIFTNLLLADEINRTPPKTQSALLEAMQGHQVTAAGATHTLSEPFFVLATQNPIEQEGTYPLPEAQLDRFLFNIMVKYPSKSEELDIMRNITSDEEPELKEVVDAKTIIEFQRLVRRIPVADHVFEYAAALVRATRPDEPDAPEFVQKLMSWGAGPRASLNLILAGKARAALRGRCHVSTDDVKAVCLPILRHRIIPSFAARSEGMTSDSLIEKLLEEIPANEDLYQEKAV
ncbi:MAG: MoxR family ATPase [Opitutales bacterium]|nr:MoxR family ATPase [Opitutales bacterium]